MIRVTLGRLDASANASLSGERVMVLGGALLIDGKRVAYKSGYRNKWVDEYGRSWDTLDFHPVTAAADASAEDHDGGDERPTRGVPEGLREQLERALQPPLKERTG